MVETPETASGELEVKLPTTEMYYNTWGSFGQHDALHHIFCDDKGCYDEIAALQLGLVELVKNNDRHSNKNYHYHRVYAYEPSKFAAVVMIKCYASSSKHRSEVQVIHGDAKVSDLLDANGSPAGYIITVGSRRWLVGRCVRGLRISIQDYDALIEREKQKKEKPKIIITYTSSMKKLKINGDTYYHRETLKQVAREMNTRLLWDSVGKYWYMEDVNDDEVEIIVNEIKKAIPGAEINVKKV